MYTGLDIGTSTIIGAGKTTSDKITYTKQRDVFFKIPINSFNKNLYEKQMKAAKINYIIDNNKLIVIGNHALELASSHNREVQRPMANGILNPKEQDNISILKAIIKSILGQSEASEGHSKVAYSLPSNGVMEGDDIVFHKSVCETILTDLGYIPFAVNEAMAIVYAELENYDFSGLAISFGGGQVNVCVAHMATPVITFSLPFSGDNIDRGIARSLNITQAEACLIKENMGDLTLTIDKMTREQKAIAAYYSAMIKNKMLTIQENLEAENIKLPKDSKLVLAGGTASIKGFKEEVEKQLVIPNISKVIIAENPILTVAKGLLIASLT